MLAREAQVAHLGLRLTGLIGRRVISAQYALGIPYCDWVHSFGVLLPLDVAYCDKEGRVLRLVRHLIPNRIAPRAPGAWIAWEMKGGGFAEDVCEGHRLIFQPCLLKEPEK